MKFREHPRQSLESLSFGRSPELRKADRLIIGLQMTLPGRNDALQLGVIQRLGEFFRIGFAVAGLKSSSHSKHEVLFDLLCPECGEKVSEDVLSKHRAFCHWPKARNRRTLSACLMHCVDILPVPVIPAVPAPSEFEACIRESFIILRTSLIPAKPRKRFSAAIDHLRRWIAARAIPFRAVSPTVFTEFSDFCHELNPDCKVPTYEKLVTGNCREFACRGFGTWLMSAASQTLFNAFTMQSKIRSNKWTIAG